MAQPPKKQRGRPASITIVAGQRFGHLVIRRKLHTKEGQRWQVECLAPLRDGSICHVVQKIPTAYLTRKNNPKVHCGCQTYIDANQFPYEKTCWQTMHLRCEYEGHISYKDYGGRGIVICERWSKRNPDGFKNFLADMGPAPKAHLYTVDRKDPDGNYEPDNCKWSDKKEQANNQRRYKK